MYLNVSRRMLDCLTFTRGSKINRHWEFQICDDFIYFFIHIITTWLGFEGCYRVGVSTNTGLGIQRDQEGKSIQFSRP